METGLQKLITSEEDDDEEMQMDVKEEDGGDDEDGEKHVDAFQMMAGVDGEMPTISNDNNRLQQHHQFQEQVGTPGGGGARRCRPMEEKERTKLRERQCRAITARILAGLRRHGNYNLRGPRLAGVNSAAVTSSSSQIVSPRTPASLKGVTAGFQSPGELNACNTKGVYLPSLSPYDLPSSARSQGSSIVGDGAGQTESHPLIGGSMDNVGNKQVYFDCLRSFCVEFDEYFKNGNISMIQVGLGPCGELRYPSCPVKHGWRYPGVGEFQCYNQYLMKSLRKATEARGHSFWGSGPDNAGSYNSGPYETGFFSDGGDYDGYYGRFFLNWYSRVLVDHGERVLSLAKLTFDGTCIAARLGVINMNSELVEPEALRNQLQVLKSVGVDGVMVDCWWGIAEAHSPQGYNWSGYKKLFQIVRDLNLKLQVYFDYMRSFRVEFDEFFEEGIISEIEVGLGPCGELRYPSYPEQHGWKYPGIGEFQCYDRYLMKNLTQAAEARGHTFWARVPDNAGSYNSQPHETGFFRDGGDYDSYYGRFFLNWYSRVLIDHGDRVLALANLAFEGTRIATKVSGIHWWYKTASHPAELTAGFYNSCNRGGYAPISAMLKKHEAPLNFTCVEMRTLDQHEGFPEALADPEGLVWQVLNAAWDANIPVASENALTCFDREGYNKILENAKPWNDPDGRHLSAFTYLRLSPVLIERHNLTEFEQFVKRMHGEAASDV